MLEIFDKARVLVEIVELVIQIQSDLERSLGFCGSSGFGSVVFISFLLLGEKERRWGLGKVFSSNSKGHQGKFHVSSLFTSSGNSFIASCVLVPSPRILILRFEVQLYSKFKLIK